MRCQKCKKEFEESSWEKDKTYKGLDIHHNPPEFISDKLQEEWSGEFYNLCRDCHVKLHKEIKKILYAKSNSLKFINSEYWLIQKMSLEQIKKAKEEIYSFTKQWIIKKNDPTTT